MDKSKKRQQQQQESDFNPRRPADEGRRTKMRMGKEITDSSGKNSNCTSSSLYKQSQPNGEGGSTGRSPRPGFDLQTHDNLYKTSARAPGLPPRPGFDPQTNDNLYKTSTIGPSLPPRPGFDPQTNDNLYKTSARSPNLPPQLSVNETKVVNWRLACFMCNEYLTRGTLLGRPWPTQDSKPNWHENNDKSQQSHSLDQDGDESRREKERLYHTLTDFLQAGDVHLPGIVNPSQLAAWLGL